MKKKPRRWRFDPYTGKPILEKKAKPRKTHPAAKFTDVLPRIAGGESVAEVAKSLGVKPGIVYGRARRMAKMLWMAALDRQRAEGCNPSAKWIPYFTGRPFDQWLREHRDVLKIQKP